MLKGNLVVDESMSNLTSTSGEVSASSGTRIKTTAGTVLNPQQSLFASTNQGAGAATTKKKRNLPGNPGPDAEVIALSPKSLLATNRFVCEICNKGFQRDQNLQLHKRGHNLPWKLKQRTINKDDQVMRKKVYVCPETTCVHHHPSRALGDLTGIKKHFCRKHGEKKWKCEKCSKRYAVQSDWKAHSKICGTREYRCDCGTLFSRRDSFITHRAFCEALAEESARAISVSNMGNNLQTQDLSVIKREEENVLNARVGAANYGSDSQYSINLSSSPLLLDNINPLGRPQNENPSSNSPAIFQAPIANSPHMSATALLQKAAQMGVTMSMTKPLQSTDHAIIAMHHMSEEIAASGFSHGLASFGNKATLLSSGNFMELQTNTAATNSTCSAGAAPPHDDMMTCLSSTTNGLEQYSFNQIWNTKLGNSSNIIHFRETTQDHHLSKTTDQSHDHEGRGGGGGISSNILGARGNNYNDGLTRDFLGLKAFPNLAWLNRINTTTSSSYGRQQNQHHTETSTSTPWQG